MKIDIIITTALTTISTIIAAIQAVVAQFKKKKEQFKEYLREELVPLMEQAERTFDEATEKENWVIKKLGDKLHIDFLKHKKILVMVLTLIKQICIDTKIDVNKVRLIEPKPEKVQEEGDGNVY